LSLAVLWQYDYTAVDNLTNGDRFCCALSSCPPR
jgi:hypothetical protein